MISAYASDEHAGGLRLPVGMHADHLGCGKRGVGAGVHAIAYLQKAFDIERYAVDRKILVGDSPLNESVIRLRPGTSGVGCQILGIGDQRNREWRRPLCPCSAASQECGCLTSSHPELERPPRNALGEA